MLQENRLYDDVKMVVDAMLRKQPANREARRLAEWVRVRIHPWQYYAVL